MKAYKLTNKNGQTRNNTQWGPNVSHSATGNPEQELCKRLGIKLVFNVGEGGKVQSSSWLLAKAAQEKKKEP